MQSTSSRLTKQQLGQYAVYFLCFATILWLIRDMIVKWTPIIHPGTDLSLYFDETQAFVRGVNPYDPAELILGSSVTGVIAAIFPPQMVLMIPFYHMGKTIGTLVFFFLSVLLSFLMFRLIFRRLNLWHPPNSTTLSKENQLFLFSLCLFFNSPHLKQAFFTGQLSQVAFFCLFFAMVTKGIFFRAVLLAIAVAAKYSVVPFIGLAFLIIRDFRTCILATLLFLAIAALPALYGHNLVTLYGEYFTKLASIAGQCGFDTYCGGKRMDHLLHFEFFKNNAINMSVRAIFLIPFATAFFLEYRLRAVSLNFLLMANAISLMMVYHRYYDMPALQLFMIASMNICFLRHRWIEGSIFTLFILLSLISVPWMEFLSYRVGTLIGENSWIYTISTLQYMYPITFPLWAIYIFIVTGFSVYFYYCSNPKIIFLNPSSEKQLESGMS